FPEPFGLSVALEARSRSVGATCLARARFDGMRRGVEDAGIVNPIHGIHPFALRATGPAFGCPNSFQTNLSLAGRFAYLAEREGFEPSIRLLTRYSLSRGAPSATRASLRGFAALLRSRLGY